jgi:hypothetical protein
VAATAPPASIMARAKTKTIFFMSFSLRNFSQLLLNPEKPCLLSRKAISMPFSLLDSEPGR